MADTTRPARSGRVARAVLVTATLGVGVGLAAIPVGNWADQREELDRARDRRTELQAEIAEIEADIAGIVSDEGLEIAARCYGMFVEVGEELYQVSGLDGCVTDPTP
jgi:cell division protein FtsB